jgi:hypothetical protein
MGVILFGMYIAFFRLKPQSQDIIPKQEALVLLSIVLWVILWVVGKFLERKERHSKHPERD